MELHHAMRLLPVFLLPSLACAGVIHVDSTAGPGGDGSSPAQAFQHLQDALGVAAPKDEIRVAAGIYFPNQSAAGSFNDPTASFVIPNFVTVIGGYKPGGTDGGTDPDSHLSILSGDFGKDDSDPNGNGIIASPDDQVGTNSHHVVTVSGGTDGVVLQGLVITAGNADGAPVNHGGGLLATGSLLTLDNCWLRGNRGGGRGGALHLDNCQLEAVNCDFAGNHSVERGGAVGTLNGSDADFTNCLIRGNESKRGGGLNFNNSYGTLLNCTLSGNHATINGGAIQAHSSNVAVTDSIIWWNLAGDPGSRAAAGASFNELSGGSVSASTSSIIENAGGADPDFINEFDPANAPDTAGNHRPSRGSPAINAGTSSANGSSTDYDGNPRVAGSAIDLGAFETQPFDLHVDDSAGGANDGSSWSNAYTTLQPALAGALPGDRILIAEGVYTPATASDSFEIPADVEILGGYPDGGGTRDPETHLAILSGDVGNDDNNLDGNFIAEQTSQLVGTNASTVVTTAPGVNLTPLNIIDGLVITAGRAVPEVPAFAGDPSTEGGGVHFTGDRPVFRNCLFSGNEAYESGGAVHVSNSPAGQLDGDGPVFENCEFIGNEGTFHGGALTVIGGRTVLRNCNFDLNEGRNGGALAHRAIGGELVLDACRIRGTENNGENGAVLLEANTSSTFVNCLLSGNRGHAVDLFGVLDMRGCTIAGNERRPVSKNGSSTSLNVWNSIFWSNDEDYFAQGGGSLAQFHHSLVEGWEAGDPGFANNGNLDGTDLANDPDFVSGIGGGIAPSLLGDFHLMFDSPVMSVGDNAETGSTSDLDGNPRISGHSVDLGALEYELPDSDADGLPDSFELAHTSPASATSLAPGSNLDGDPFSALQEFAFDIDPNVAEATGAAYEVLWNDSQRRLELYWTPNPAAFHYLRIIPELSNDFGISEPWFETAIRFGRSPGEFRADTQTISPRPLQQYLRLRVAD